jgi:hypothetical protein
MVVGFRSSLLLCGWLGGAALVAIRCDRRTVIVAGTVTMAVAMTVAVTATVTVVVIVLCNDATTSN